MATGSAEEECPYEIESDELIFRGEWMSGRQVNFVDKASGVRKVRVVAFFLQNAPRIACARAPTEMAIVRCVTQRVHRTEHACDNNGLAVDR
jgi:hypothetical protein